MLPVRDGLTLACKKLTCKSLKASGRYWNGEPGRGTHGTKIVIVFSWDWLTLEAERVSKISVV